MKGEKPTMNIISFHDFNKTSFDDMFKHNHYIRKEPLA